jgi:hypothetical protein
MTTENDLGFFDAQLRKLARKTSVFGSDVYVNYTHEYVWQANQIGHVFIGLFFGLLLLWLSCGSRIGLLIGLGLYVIKELIDYLITVRLSEGVFPPKKTEVARDCIADLLFVAGGAFVAISVAPSVVAPYCNSYDVSAEQWLALLSFAGIICFFLLTRIHFLKPKRAFDKSGMSWLARLSDFPDNFCPKELPGLKKEIPSFARGKSSFQHLVVSGPPQSGRTTLAQSIGGDATAAQRQVRSLAAQRLFEKTRVGFETPSAKAQPHQVAEADLVIVDGITVFPDQEDPKAGLVLDEMLNELVDVDGTTVFHKRVCELDDDGSPQPIGVEPRDLPQTVWVFDDDESAEQLRSAVEKKFGQSVELVSLQGKLKRRMRLEE